MNLLSRATLPLPVLFALAACASQSPDPPGSSPTGVAESAGAIAGSTPGLEQLRRGGVYMFSLDESTPATKIRTECAAEGAGDNAKAEACYALVRTQGNTEGMRFSLDADHHVVWTSFGNDDGKQAIYLEGPLAVAADGERGVVGTFASMPHGTQMAGKTALPTRPVHFEFVDATTLVMNDEVKGRLVFHRPAQ